jgi:hypothetical protein
MFNRADPVGATAAFNTTPPPESVDSKLPYGIL